MRLMKKVLVTDLAVLALALLVWLLYWERTLASLCWILVILGALVVYLGSLMESGARQGSVEYLYHESKLAGSASHEERLWREMSDIYDSFRSATVLYIAGSIAMGIGGGVLIWIV